MEDRTYRQLECARRSCQAAVEHMQKGDFRTAGALFRCARRYLSEVCEGKDDEAGVLVCFPLAHGPAGGARELAHGCG